MNKSPGFLISALVLAVVCAANAETNPATEPTVQAVAKAMPAVVNINTERVVKRTIRDPYDEVFNKFFRGQRPRTYSQTVQSLGSGFLVDAAGFIVTNEHVVERAENLRISVTVNDGKTYEARYITGSTESDLAFIKIDSAQPLPFLSLDDLSPSLLGQTVLVLGNPLGYGSSVSRGILSAKARTVTVNNNEYKDLLQTDAAINPGNSGGPLVDINGRLVGVSSVKMAYTEQGVPTQGLGFAIPAPTVRDKVVEFRKEAASQKPGTKKSVPTTLARKYFGLQIQDLTEELGESLGYVAGSGVLIADIEAKSPAETAGMKRGLVIAQVGRFPVGSVQQVEELLGTIASGSEVDFTVFIARRVGNRNVRQQQIVQLIAR